MMHTELFNTILDEQKLKFDREGQRRTQYSLRHTYICLRLMEGADIYQIAKNCRTSVKMIEDFYASHIKDLLDTASINVRAAPFLPQARGRNGPEATPPAEEFGKNQINLGGDRAEPIHFRLVRGRGEIGRRKGLKHLSALRETRGVELPKFGETS